MLEAQLLELLETKKEYYENLQKTNQKRKQIIKSKPFLIENYQVTSDIQKEISIYYIEYAKFLKGEKKDYNEFTKVEQAKIVKLIQSISLKINNLLGKEETNSVIKTYERLLLDFNLITNPDEYKDFGQKMVTLQNNNRDLINYYNNLRNIQTMLIEVINLGNLANSNKQYNSYKKINGELNKILTMQSLNPELRSYFDCLLEEYNYQSLIETANKNIKNLEKQDHDHFYMAVKLDDEDNVTLKCAICGEEKVIPYTSNDIYYGTKTGGLLKKKRDRIEALKYIIENKKDENKETEVNVAKIKVIRNAQKRKK